MDLAGKTIEVYQKDRVQVESGAGISTCFFVETPTYGPKLYDLYRATGGTFIELKTPKLFWI